MTPTEVQTREAAIRFAKANKKAIAKRLTDKERYPPEENPVSVFMAGSPGAGKTEASKALLDAFDDEVLRIDPDELRTEFEQYDGTNSWLFQAAVSILVEKAHDLALKNRQSFLLDGTLTNLGKARDNIKRSLSKGRAVQILYVYQEPTTAWEFVKAREAVEGRKIRVQDFIDQYFAARDSVNTLKREFEQGLHVDLLLQNRDNTTRSYKDNIDQIDHHIPEKYTREELEKSLLED